MKPAWLVVLLLALSYSCASASKENLACTAYDHPNFVQKRVCENATLTELDRKLIKLEDELWNGWHINWTDTAPGAGNFRENLLAFCTTDTCLETEYRAQLNVLDALPVFRCVGRLNAAERAVCNTPALGHLDRELNLEYGLALDESYAMLALRVDQGRWRRSVRDGCGASVACLGRVYRARLTMLRRVQMLVEQRQKREPRRNPDDRGAGLKLKFTPAQQQSIQAQLNEYTDEADSTEPNCLSRPVDLLNLNQGGHPDPVFLTCGGGSNDTAFFFLWQRGQYRLVLEDTVGYFGYTVQDTRTHGLPMLRLISHTSCCEHGNAYYAYDGQMYRAVACYNERFVREDFYIFENLGKPEGESCTF
jgi:uncharacterized protein